MKKKATVLFLLLCWAGLCRAQKDSLLIGPGDEIHIQVFDTPELEEHARVTDQGTIDLILGGTVKVAGLTPDGAARLIENVLRTKRYMNAPHVIVSVDQYATENVSILGEVKTPGSFPIETPRSIIDVLSLAGGVTDLADRRITIQRHGSKETVAYFLSNDSRTALDHAVMVYPGDTIIVPKANVVYVLGDVGRPGGYPRSTDDSQITVLQAVSMAGGTNPSAKTSHTRLIRKNPDGTYVEMALPLAAMEKGKRADILMQPNDIIYVPFSYLKNMAVGMAGIVASAGSAAIYVH